MTLCCVNGIQLKNPVWNFQTGLLILFLHLFIQQWLPSRGYQARRHIEFPEVSYTVSR